MRPGRERLFLAPRRQLTEALPGLHEDRGLAARPLVAADNHVDVKRIELDSAADAAGLVRCDEGRTGAEDGSTGVVTTIRMEWREVLEVRFRSSGGRSLPRLERLLSEDAQRAAGYEVALKVEVIVDGSVDRQEAR
jgi:hypothetical protein